jgi:hypothetical protein
MTIIRDHLTTTTTIIITIIREDHLTTTTTTIIIIIIIIATVGFGFCGLIYNLLIRCSCQNSNKTRIQKW